MGISGGGGGKALYQANYRPGGYIIPATTGIAGTSYGTISLLADDAFFSPVSFDLSFLCSNVEFYVPTVPTAGNMRVGVYGSDGNGNPGTLIFSSVDLVISTIGIKSISLNNLAISAFSKYWIGLHCSVNSITVNGIAGYPVNSGISSPFIGVSGGITQDAVYLNTPYANGLPQIYPNYVSSIGSRIMLAYQMV